MHVTSDAASARQLPATKGLPWVGMLPHVSRHGLLRTFETLWSQHGDIFELHVAKQRLIVMVHPDAVQHVLVTSADRYVKAGTYDELRQLVGELALLLHLLPQALRLPLLPFRRKLLLRLAQLRLRGDGSGVAIGGDGSLLVVQVTPP